MQKEKGVNDYLENGLSKIHAAVRFWKNFQKDVKFTNKDYVVVLMSDEKEVNQYTIQYLNALKSEKNLNRIFLLACDKDMEEIIDGKDIPAQLVIYPRQDLENLACLHNLYKFSGNITFNTFQGTSDTDGFLLTQLEEISIKDVVAVSILGLEKVPDEQTVYARNSDRLNYKPIDWDTEQKGIMMTNEFDSVEERIHKGLKGILSSGIITKEDRIVLFGATTASMEIMDQLPGYSILAIVDNNRTKTGREIRGIKVYTPEEYLGDYKPDIKILIASQYYRQMCEQLYYLGYELGKQTYVVFGESNKWNVSDQTIHYMEKCIHEGFGIYQDIRSQYKNEKMMLCPYPGTGDLYLIGLYKEELEKEGRAVYVVCSNASAKVAALYEMETVVLTLEEMKSLLRFMRAAGVQNMNAKILNDCIDQITVGNMRGYHGIDFHTMFSRCVFNVLQRKENSPGIIQKDSSSIFEQYNLKPGKTVLISPYANTISNVSMAMWKNIISRLQKMGMDVCTNVADDQETALPDTRGIFIPYSQIIGFLDRAGYFIGLRSGLCDIISTTKARVCILYPEGNIFSNCTTYDYFSLVNMGFRDSDLLEIVYSEKSEMEECDRLIAFFENETED